MDEESTCLVNGRILGQYSAFYEAATRNGLNDKDLQVHLMEEDDDDDDE